MTSINARSHQSETALASFGFQPSAGMWFAALEGRYADRETSDITNGRLKPCVNLDSVGRHEKRKGRGSP